ncbi:MAG: hypothetical protein ACHQXK_01550 [Methanosarcina thermophila]|uniref:hypothetical protein n=1 Tax=Methanosarcina thermophila TaxID=2210 RepID=UPI000B28C209|nr:hypothetical protein [Methanosarcina thermophila]NLU58101.1 hypothetical protein [Methanosarcina thermophila]GLI15280.1 hypothetical protein MTHERMMSTA1_24060 [Methanosarcina thermophila MST-A1]HOA70035.1 hypothetical protein [Methanosarcina thermophila]HOQ66816.1 hypothetical protein [Methanosarcina thermophila]HPT81957.1 hypothetical protein [Methanosarcina thermophila]
MLVLAISLVAAGFAGTGSTTGENDTGSAKATWVTAQASADQVSIPSQLGG